MYRYLSRERFRQRFGYYHPDPLIDEFTYGEGGGFSTFVWNNINKGSRVFFHTSISGARYLTAMYHITDFAPAGVWRLDSKMKSRFNNPHLHPEIFKEWWGGEYDPADDIEIKKAYNSNLICSNADVILIGDPKRSYDIRKAPLVLDKEILSRLDLNGKPVKWDIVDNKGRIFNENKCITTCLRPPRVLSKEDGDFLEQLVRHRFEKLTLNASLENFVPLNLIVSSKIYFTGKTEKDIENIIINNIQSLGEDLEFVDNQVILSDGNRIDILARNSKDVPIIIEIKKGIADDSTLTQLISYIHQYKKQHPADSPMGKIVCANASYKLKNACEHLGIRIHFYEEILKCYKEKGGS